MEGLLARTGLLSLVALLAASCAATAPPQTADMTELARLPTESKFYFQQPLRIPARTNRVWLPAESVRGIKADLSIPPTEVDRLIEADTPLLLDGIELPAKGKPRASCTITLALKSPAGVGMKLRLSRETRSAACPPLTVGDLEGLAMVVPSPPRPIQ